MTGVGSKIAGLGFPTRLGFAVAGVLLVAVGLFSATTLIARLLSPDGEITEIVYVYVLRALVVVAGSGLVAAAARASLGLLHRLLLVIVAVAITIGTLELVLRAAERVSRRDEPDTLRGIRRSQHPDLIWEATPSFAVDDRALTFNSLGLRDDERSYSRTTDTIVVVGDSIESERDLVPAELYSRRLEAMLNAAPGRPAVQALNFSVPGYSLHQKILTLKYRGLEWKPSRVVVGYCLNDPIPSSEYSAYFENRPSPLVALRSLSLLNDRVRLVMHGLGQDFHTEIHAEGSDSWAGVKNDLAELASLAKQHQFKAVLLIFPLLYKTSGDYPWADIHRRVTEVATSVGLPVIDLLDSYRREGIEKVRFDDVHPNGRGHEIAAVRLSEALARNSLDWTW